MQDGVQPIVSPLGIYGDVYPPPSFAPPDGFYVEFRSSARDPTTRRVHVTLGSHVCLNAVGRCERGGGRGVRQYGSLVYMDGTVV